MEDLSTIGDFLVLQELGHGGMGAVYIGYEASHRRLVVIKTLFEQWAKEESFVKRFQREASSRWYRGGPDRGDDPGRHGRAPWRRIACRSSRI